MAVLLAGALVALSCSSSDADDATAGGATSTTDGASPPATVQALPDSLREYSSATYADDSHWLCKPGIANDVCSRDLDVTAVAADGTTEVQPHERAEDPRADCFYVYPTTSDDQSVFSDLVPSESAEIATTVNQAARYTSACDVYAPLYPQFTLAALLGQVELPEGERPDTAYQGMLDAFRHYVADDNDGRGFVLIGHSQGAGLLARLIDEEIADEPALRDRFISAHLLGTSVGVGPDSPVPACDSAESFDCIVSYSSYLADDPPGADGVFGVVRPEVGEAVCVNPADPSLAFGETAAVTLVSTTAGATVVVEGTSPPDIDTPFVSYPGLVDAACEADGDHRYLALTVRPDPGPRVDTVGQSLRVAGHWGMHLIDVDVAIGELVDLASNQIDAYVDR